MARLAGIRVVWSVHELAMKLSEHPVRDRIATQMVAFLAHDIIIHCEAARPLLSAVAGARAGRKAAVVLHGHFIDTYTNDVTRDVARRKLGLGDDELVVLALGDIRRYKGIYPLIQTFMRLETEGARLIVAGEFLHRPTYERIARLIETPDPRVMIIPERVPDDDVQVYMNAADVAVVPYLDILTSSAIILAMTFGRAIIAPRIGCIVDNIDERGAFLYDVDDPEGLAGALRKAIERRTALQAMGEHNRATVAQWKWEDVAAATLAVYQGRRRSMNR
jgi:glycosyltransferase involved in cell wall biosynthesis